MPLYAVLARDYFPPQVMGTVLGGITMTASLGMAFGPAEGLALVDAMRDNPALQSYQWLPSVRGDLLARLGRHAEASAEFERAAGLAGNARERELLQARARNPESTPGAGPAGKR